MRNESSSQFLLSSPLGETFARNANLWFATHAEWLANVDAMTHAWLERRREGVEAMRETIQEMTECKDPAEMLRIQQEWLSGASRRLTQDIAMLNDGISSMTEKATSDFEKAAVKAGKPLHLVDEAMLKAAGTKPQKRKPAD